MKISLRWLQDVAFETTGAGGHQIIFDGPAEHGGKNLGPRPMEGLLAATAACSAFDVIHILQKSRQIPASLNLHVAADRADKIPAVFTRIHLRFLLSGKNLRPAAVARAVQLSAEKYCSALAMLNKTATISHEWLIDS